MILDKKVKIRINSRNFNYYKDILIEISNNMYYEIDIHNLFPGSHLKINVECDICKSELIKPYRQYLSSLKNKYVYCCSSECALFKNKETNLDRYGYENSFQVESFKDKIKETNLEKYGVEYPTKSKDIRRKIKNTLIEKFGVENPSLSEEIKDKIKKTCLEKYGYENANQCPDKKEKAKLTRIKKGLQLSDDLKKPFDLYRKLVDNLTSKNKNRLLESWNGYDYYDSEYIKDNFSLSSGNADFPTIDHKISVKYGFENNISPDEIAKIKNLCITKRKINSSKGSDCNFITD